MGWMSRVVCVCVGRVRVCESIALTGLLVLGQDNANSCGVCECTVSDTGVFLGFCRGRSDRGQLSFAFHL